MLLGYRFGRANGGRGGDSLCILSDKLAAKKSNARGYIQLI